MTEPQVRRIVLGISGSSGAIYGTRLLEILAGVPTVETHLIITHGARATITFETPHQPDEVEALADVVHDDANLAAPLASGTFVTDGMIVAPCSIKTLSAIANSYNDALITRAADVCLKERRPLVLAVRETPLHLGHLRLMVRATEAGAVIAPPMPGYYTRPESISDIIDHTATKVLDQFGIRTSLIPRWEGPPKW